MMKSGSRMGMQTRQMKRSPSEGESKGQVGRVKRSKIQVEESSKSPEFNPFLVETILVKLLKLVDRVSQLKDLRLMCQTWDEFNLKELEERAFNGKLKAIDFQWTNKFDTISEAEANLVQFMRDTEFIPRLFYSFKFNFPESWKIFCYHMEFFSLYPVTFINLAIPNYVAALEQTAVLLIKFMESATWENLKEITISILREGKFGLPSSSIFVPSSSSDDVQLKLQKLDLQIDSSMIFRIFKASFASGRYTNLTSMGLEILQNGNLNFPGLDLTKLTRLEIDKIGLGSSPALKFTSGLINLAENGMTLKKFGINIKLTPITTDEFFFENLPLICSNLTHFLSSQSSTLASLFFGFACYLENPVNVEGAERCQIHLPKFEVLHSLRLMVDFQLIEANPRKIHTQLFGMTHHLSHHFPKLVNLILDGDSSLTALNGNPAPDESGQLHLKCLEIFEYDKKTPIWNTSFMGVVGSVEDLTCAATLLCGGILPWGESLSQLYIYNIFRVEEKFFKLNHLKKLKKLTTEYYAINEGLIRVGSCGFTFLFKKIGDYLNYFKEAAELPLTSITFQGPKMPKAFKKQIINYFPFPVEFKKEVDF